MAQSQTPTSSGGYVPPGAGATQLASGDMTSADAMIAALKGSLGQSTFLTPEQQASFLAGWGTDLQPSIAKSITMWAEAPSQRNVHMRDEATLADGGHYFGPGGTTTSGRLVTVADQIAKLHQMSDTELATFQAKMVAGGMLKKGDYTPGVIDDNTISGFKELLLETARAVGQNKTMEDVLNAHIRATNEKGPSSQGIAATVTVTDPRALQLMARKIGTSVLGHRPSDAEIQKITGAIQAAQRSQQMVDINNQASVSAANQNDAGRGLSVVENTTVDPQAQAETMLRQAHPVEAGAHDMANAYESLLSMIRGGAG